LQDTSRHGRPIVDDVAMADRPADATRSFRRDDLTAALGARSVVQATLMRVTIGTSIPHDGGPWRTSALALEAFHG
jgi:hypothetical protein